MSAWQIVGLFMIFFSIFFFLIARGLGLLKDRFTFAFFIACTGFIFVAAHLITGSLP